LFFHKVTDSLLAQRPKLSDGLGGAGGAHRALTTSRDARTDGEEAVRCSAWLGVIVACIAEATRSPSSR
jgi:hypothetical protein